MTTSTKWTETIYSLLADKLNSEKPTDCQEYIEDLESHLEEDIHEEAKSLTTYSHQCMELVKELETDYSTEEIEDTGNYTIGESMAFG